MNEAFGKDFYRKGNSVKRSGRFSEPPDSERPEKLLSSSPSATSALTRRKFKHITFQLSGPLRLRVRKWFRTRRLSTPTCVWMRDRGLPITLPIAEAVL